MTGRTADDARDQAAGAARNLEHRIIGVVVLAGMKRACPMIFRVMSVFCGTTEIMKEIIARDITGLWT